MKKHIKKYHPHGIAVLVATPLVVFGMLAYQNTYAEISGTCTVNPASTKIVLGTRINYVSSIKSENNPNYFFNYRYDKSNTSAKDTYGINSYTSGGVGFDALYMTFDGKNKSQNIFGQYSVQEKMIVDKIDKKTKKVLATYESMCPSVKLDIPSVSVTGLESGVAQYPNPAVYATFLNIPTSYKIELMAYNKFDKDLASMEIKASQVGTPLIGDGKKNIQYKTTLPANYATFNLDPYNLPDHYKIRISSNVNLGGNYTTLRVVGYSKSFTIKK